MVLFGTICLGGASAADREASAPGSLRVRSVVRADARSGRLVRSVVVQGRAVPQPSVPELLEALPASASADLETVVGASASRHGVDPDLVLSLIDVESARNPYAVSHKGAQGLMQLMPDTARRFGVANPFDVRQNVEGGVRYLAYLQTLFSDLRLVLAAYNAGEGAVWKYGNRIPPYRETVDYVDKVGRKYGQRQAAAPRPAGPISETPEPVEAVPSGKPEYARVEAYIDQQGRLHMRNAEAAEIGTP
jgi:soluble lytic murein transglycosylase-like protein